MNAPGSSAAADFSIAELPAYSIEASRSNSPAPDQTLSPGPSVSSAAVPHRQRSEHTYLLSDRKNKPWAILMVYSSGRQYSQRMPTFVEGEPIEGSLTLDIDKKESITSVLVTVS
jgi:hypothetical protein